jgi:putative acetyltransferase
VSVRGVTIAKERPDQPDVMPLIAAIDKLMVELYPPESNHLLDIAALLDPAVTFLVARCAGAAVGCGAILNDPRGWGEVKRMFVMPEQRGKRLGARMLSRLEDAAVTAQLPLLRLETGIHNKDALALYRRAGFAECEPFGDYAPDPLSVFMEKNVRSISSDSGSDACRAI